MKGLHGHFELVPLKVPTVRLCEWSDLTGIYLGLDFCHLILGILMNPFWVRWQLKDVTQRLN